MAIIVKERTERYNISVYPETELSIELLWQKENLFKRLLKQINYVGLLCGFENKENGVTNLSKNFEHINRIREALDDLVMMNDFEYFLTVTFDPKKVDFHNAIEKLLKKVK